MPNVRRASIARFAPSPTRTAGSPIFAPAAPAKTQSFAA